MNAAIPYPNSYLWVPFRQYPQEIYPQVFKCQHRPMEDSELAAKKRPQSPAKFGGFFLL